MGEQKIYINGEFFDKSNACISVYDHGLLYGDGIFEGIRVYNNRIFKLDEHIERLYFSAKCIALNIPMSIKNMKKDVIKAVKENKLSDAYIRLIVTRGIGDLGIDPSSCKSATVIIIVDKIKLYPDELYETGLEVITSSNRRTSVEALNPRVKSLNYLNNIMAKMEGHRNGYKEVVMLNSDNLVAECSADNIFILDKGILKTPFLYLGALEGITRNTIIDIAKKNNIQFEEAAFTRFDLYGAKEVFLTGTAAEVIPVVKVDDRVIGDGKPGVIFKKLRNIYKKLVNMGE